MASKLCDSCKSATAAIYCRPDAAFLCVSCDSRIHTANKLASRHPRVWMCEVCEQAPAHVTCRADAAALCVTCDRDIHSANPLASRHERIPVTPFYGPPAANIHGSGSSSFLDDRYFPAKYGEGGDDVSGEEEEEAASWLLPDPNPKGGDGCGRSPEINTGQYLFSEMDPYLDLDYPPVDPKTEAQDQNSSGTDGVVPIQSNGGAPVHHMVNEHCYDLDFTPSKPYSYGYNCLSQSMSSSSMEVGVVPDGGSTAEEVYGKPMCNITEPPVAVPLSSADREARVLRYREKRKNRRFEKTIRYASRKAYAEMRPRIKGRFAKRSEVRMEADTNAVYGGVVPTC